MCIPLLNVWKILREAELLDACEKSTRVVQIWSALIPTTVSWHESKYEFILNKNYVSNTLNWLSAFNLTSALFAETDIYSEVVVLLKVTSTIERFENLKGTQACIAEFAGIGLLDISPFSLSID